MIVFTMEESEIMKEIKTDFPHVYKYSEHYDSIFRRKVVKAKKYPIFMNVAYISPKKNKWLIFYEARSKKEFGKYSRLAFVTYIESERGIYAIMTAFTNSNPHLVIYQPHFFKRYSERFGIDMSGISLITHYFTSNHSYVYSYSTHIISKDSYQEEVFGSSKDGVALGIRTTGGNVLFKTFITYSMTKGEQIEVFAKNEKIRQEIHEKV